MFLCLSDQVVIVLQTFQTFFEYLALMMIAKANMSSHCIVYGQES